MQDDFHLPGMYISDVTHDVWEEKDEQVCEERHTIMNLVLCVMTLRCM